jgi:hypothetical protein
VSADPSPVPARDDAPEVHWTVEREDGRFLSALYPTRDPRWIQETDESMPHSGLRFVPVTRVPSPDVLRAECEALEALTRNRHSDSIVNGINVHATLRVMLKRQRALLAAVTRDDAGDGKAEGGMATPDALNPCQFCGNETHYGDRVALGVRRIEHDGAQARVTYLSAGPYAHRACVRLFEQRLLYGDPTAEPPRGILHAEREP